MYRRNDGFWMWFERFQDCRQRRCLRRLAKLRDVGAGDKGPSLATQNDDLGVIARRCLQRIDDALSHVLWEGVDRRWVDHDIADLAMGEIAHWCCHAGLAWGIRYKNESVWMRRCVASRRGKQMLRLMRR